MMCGYCWGHTYPDLTPGTPLPNTSRLAPPAPASETEGKEG